MRFAFKSNTAESSATISYIDGYDLLSNSAINVLHMTYTNPYNSVSSNIEIIEEHLSLDKVLEIEKTVGNIRITDEVSYDYETDETNNLWYSSTFSYPYYNTTGKTRMVSRSIDINNEEPIIRGLINNNNQIIVMDSDAVSRGYGPVGVYVDGVSEANRLRQDRYSIDAGLGIVKIDTKSLAMGIHTFTIKYKVVIKDLTIDEYPSQYRIELKSAYGDVYYASIFSVKRASYQIKYKTIDVNNNSKDIVENTIPTDIFIPAVTMGGTILDKKYEILDQNKFRINNNPLRTYYAQPIVRKNSRISLKIPQGIRTHEDWYMEVWNDSFIDDMYDLHYVVLEGKDSDYDGSYIREMVEIPVIIAFNIIGITEYPIISRTIDGGIKGIEVFVNNSPVNILNIDINNKQLIISTSIRASDDILVRYKYKTYSVQLYELSLNPRKEITNTFLDIRNNYLIYFILPTEDLKSDAKQSIFIYPMTKESKYDTIHIRENATDLLLTQDFKDYMNSTYGSLLNTSTLHPYILGVVYVEGKYNPSASVFYDMRIEGGGIHPKQDISIYDQTHVVWNMFDIGRWDGELFDTSGIIIVKIPTSLLTELSERLKVYDASLVFNTTNNVDGLAISKAKEFIRQRVNKRCPVGRTILIEFED